MGHKDKDAGRAYRRKYAKDNPEQMRNTQLKTKYGMTLEQYDQKLLEQEGLCAICRRSCPTGRNLSVDHDHSCCSGYRSCGSCIRGLLCASCNGALGQFGEDPMRLQSAIHYLKEWN